MRSRRRYIPLTFPAKSVTGGATGGWGSYCAFCRIVFVYSIGRRANFPGTGKMTMSTAVWSVLNQIRLSHLDESFRGVRNVLVNCLVTGRPVCESVCESVGQHVMSASCEGSTRFLLRTVAAASAGRSACARAFGNCCLLCAAGEELS